MCRWRGLTGIIIMAALAGWSAIAVLRADVQTPAPGGTLRSYHAYAECRTNPRGQQRWYVVTDAYYSYPETVLRRYRIEERETDQPCDKPAPPSSTWIQELVPPAFPNVPDGHVIQIECINTYWHQVTYLAYRVGNERALRIAKPAELLVNTMVPCDQAAPGLTLAWDGQSPRALDGLLAMAEATGQASVIVGLDVPFTPEGELTAPEIDAQRAAIAAAQNTLLGELEPFGVSGVQTLVTIPFIGMRANAAALSFMGGSKHVASVTENQILAPLLGVSTVRIGAQAVQASGNRGQNQTIVILDTGIDRTHPFFAGRIAGEACVSSAGGSGQSLCPGGVLFVEAPGAAADCDAAIAGCGHGTLVAGIAMGNGATAGQSFSGVAPDARVFMIKVFYRENSPQVCQTHGLTAPCALSDVFAQANALDWIQRVLLPRGPIAAINMSIGGGRFPNQIQCNAQFPGTEVAIRNLRSLGVPTIIASGNNGFTDALGAPACVSPAISVGAVLNTQAPPDDVWGGSNSAPFLSLLAPGVTIFTSQLGGGFASRGGTSAAAPHVTGAWALIKQARPTASVDNVLNMLRTTGLPIADTRTGAGGRVVPRIDVANALGIVAVPPCTFNLSAFAALPTAAGGNFIVLVTPSAPTCAWTATSPVPWLTITAGASGTGNGQVNFTAAANTTGANRTAQLQIAGAAFTVTQSAGAPVTGVPNDLCGNAVMIAATPFHHTMDTLFATRTAGDPATCAGTGEQNVWYRFTAPDDGVIAVDTVGSSYDTVVAAYTGTCSLLTFRDCNDDATPGLRHSALAIPATAGTTYFFMVSRLFQAGTLTFNLRFDRGPTITRVAPVSGIPTGGTHIEIIGTNFVPGATVSFDGTPIRVLEVQPTLIRAVTPPNANVGVGVEVRVTNPGGLFTVRPNGFFYVAAATNPTADTDGDGMPDVWEQQFSLDPFNNDASGDPDGDGVTNLAEYQAGTHPRGYYKRYLAEGAVGSFFETVIAIANAETSPTQVVLAYMNGAGAVTTEHVPMSPLSRGTVRPAARLGTADFATLVESDWPVAVDRTMKWDAQGYGSHAETAVNGPATQWYLAEGATHGAFSLFYLIQNPAATDADVQITYLRPAGAAPIVQTYRVTARSRFTIWVDQIAGLDSTDVSAGIVSTNGVPIIVERAMYYDRPGQPFAAGHESAGVTRAATSWFLAEGATGSFFDLFLLVANPNLTDAQVEATYLLPTGATVKKSYVVAAQSRFNIFVDGEDPQLTDTAVSTVVRSTNGVDIIVERAMWWPSPVWHEAHNSPGSTYTGIKWVLGEGELGGTSSVSTYVLIANTSTFDATVRVTLLFENGQTAERTYAVPANSRFNVDVAGEFPAAAGMRFSAIVESLGTPAAEIVVERAMYSNANGVMWAAGTNALGTRLP